MELVGDRQRVTVGLEALGSIARQQSRTATAAELRSLLAPVSTLPLAVVLVQRVKHSEGAELNRCLGLAGALEWLYGITFVIGAVI